MIDTARSPLVAPFAALLLGLACCGDDGGGTTQAGSSTTDAATSSGTEVGTSAPTSGSSEATTTSETGTEGPTSTSEDVGTTTTATTTSDTDSTGGDEPALSPGCGQPPLHPAGGVQVEIDAGPAGDGMRGFFLSLPADYDPDQPHRLVLGYPGTNWTGEMIQPYLALEDEAEGDAIFVYPDPLWRDFPGWGVLGGWVLGPNAAPADGEQDLVFTAAILDYMAEHYCIDETRVFATGHSWGGDMAMVVSCFLGDRFRASVPVAANRPYWFAEQGGGATSCAGATAVWTMFGVADDHFTDQDYPGQFGDECRDFWLAESECAGVEQFVDLELGAAMECVEYTGCSRPTRYCLYDESFGHQRPDYFPAEAMAFFRSF
ncbi:alpha/beta hydrolase family esterase [Nannocystis radixulma]|uniref:Prolyl oligopeptidase family serine peptidase n=1 Tax=Nannocystis radixulma TaxID=2995305 RepID=A0ABT5B3E5_9BACT|nr:prolyl oligopeptidase family serine peptidase [Nannocystis radixulma]MDC0668054.1 prolyl oligopeptidase family serine peptidase [Nannocystis radixulma]